MLVFHWLFTLSKFVVPFGCFRELIIWKKIKNHMTFLTILQTRILPNCIVHSNLENVSIFVQNWFFFNSDLFSEIQSFEAPNGKTYSISELHIFIVNYLSATNYGFLKLNFNHCIKLNSFSPLCFQCSCIAW